MAMKDASDVVMPLTLRMVVSIARMFRTLVLIHARRIQERRLASFAAEHFI
jgi:hypothetical protein